MQSAVMRQRCEREISYNQRQWSATSVGELTMQAHVSKTTQTCFFHLRRLRQVRRLLGHGVTANLIAAFVFSRLDIMATLCSPGCMPHATIAPLQQVINAAVRLVYGLCLRDHMSQLLRE